MTEEREREMKQKRDFSTTVKKEEKKVTRYGDRKMRTGICFCHHSHYFVHATREQIPQDVHTVKDKE